MMPAIVSKSMLTGVTRVLTMIMRSFGHGDDDDSDDGDDVDVVVDGVY